MGVAVDQLPKASPGLWLLAAPAAIALGFFVVQGPKWCLVGLIASTIFGFSDYSFAAGPIDLRVPDFFYVALAVWALVLRSQGGPRGYLIGRRWLALWLAALGFSLYPLLVLGTASADSFVPWLRLVATFSLVWLVPYALRTVADVEFLLGTLAFVATTEVGVATITTLARGDLTDRLSGANGPNTTGLLAALILVLAVHGPVPRSRLPRNTMVLVGVTGLLMTRSLGGTAAAVVALGIYGVRAARARRDGRRESLVTPSRLLLMLVAGLAIATILRPTNLPGSPEFGHSSTMHRIVLADAGLQLFAEEPLTGIGWQRTKDEIGAPELNADLRDHYGTSVNPHFFPEVDRTTTVHNAYVQILAESGLVGFVLFLALLVGFAEGITRVLRDARANRDLFICARAALVLLFATMIWWNDNALFGSQPETVLAALFLGILAAVPVIQHSGPSPATPRTASR